MNKWIILLLALCSVAIIAEESRDADKQLRRMAVADEVVFAVKTTQRGADIAAFNNFLPQELKPFDAQHTEALFTIQDDDGQFLTIFVHKMASRTNLRSAIASLKATPQVKWAEPNYEFAGDPREDMPESNDPQFSEQYHHQVMQNPNAWKLNPGKASVVVAVTDDGVDIDHEDLAKNIWRNPREIPGNGIDDDNNGFVDDVTGWDFSSEDNDPRPNGSDSHGTHVAGIIAAELNNGKGVSGTAPGVAVMPIRFYGSGAWTATVVAKSYAYAVDNGAKIITTSFNINGFVGNQTYESAIKYVYQNDVLLFNSGGNGSEKDPARQAFHEVLLVASTIADNSSNDEKSSYSNWGIGMDISAPGGGGSAGILSTVPRNQYSRKSGTSMASPNAAAVAALIWSKNPGWTRDQVAAHLFSSSDDINAVNSAYKDLLGAGRVNSYNAVNAVTKAPVVREIRELKSKSSISTLAKITVVLPSIFDRASVENTNNWELVSQDGKRVALKLQRSYLIGSNEVVFEFDRLAAGQYKFTGFAKNLVNPFGTPMAQDFVKEFTITSEE